MKPFGVPEEVPVGSITNKANLTMSHPIPKEVEEKVQAFAEKYVEYIKTISIGQYNDKGVNIGFKTAYNLIVDDYRQALLSVYNSGEGNKNAVVKEYKDEGVMFVLKVEDGKTYEASMPIPKWEEVGKVELRDVSAPSSEDNT